MIDDLKSIAIFAKTMEAGSFRGAARLLDLSPSVVSYHISQLEQQVGTPLLYRTTRKLSLTHEGELMLSYANEMLANATKGLNLVSVEKAEPEGKLKISLPSPLLKAPLTEKLAGFCQQYPKIEMHLSYTDLRQDLIANGIDMAIRIGKLEDSSLKSKRLGQIKRLLVCTKDYYATKPKPKRPSDLSQWHWIKLAMLPGKRTLVNTSGSAGQTETVNFESHIIVDSVAAMTEYCLHGLGLATPPDYMVKNHLAKGDLVEVLPNWQVEPIDMYAVWPGNISQGSNTRVLLNYLLEGN